MIIFIGTHFQFLLHDYGNCDHPTYKSDSVELYFHRINYKATICDALIFRAAQITAFHWVVDYGGIRAISTAGDNLCLPFI